MLIKIISSIIGFRMAGFVGLLIGLFVGFLFDKNFQARLEKSRLVRLLRQSSLGQGSLGGSSFSDSDRVFFNSCFSMFAKLAKADGPIVRSEIESIDYVMKNILSLDKSTRGRAIQIFKEAKDDSSTFDQHLSAFYKHYSDKEPILRALIETLFTIALSDGPLKESEEKLIHLASKTFKFSEDTYNSIKFRYVGATAAKVTPKMNPYEVLECSASESNEAIKKKYRLLVQQYHPDKLASKDLPKGFEKAAGKKFRDIHEAFSIIKDQRGFD